MAKDLRLIDANLLEEAVHESKSYNPHMTSVARQNHMYEHDHFLKLIALAPTVDAAEVAHGQWLGEGDGYADGRLVYDVWFALNVISALTAVSMIRNCFPSIAKTAAQRWIRRASMQTEMVDIPSAKEYVKANYPNDPLLKHIVVTVLDQLPKVEAIPVAVMEREINRVGAADQCDQARRYDYALRHALEIVLEWYRSPRYKEMVEYGQKMGSR